MSRHFEHRRLYRLERAELESGVEIIGAAIRQQQLRIGAVVAVAQGGRLFGDLLARYLCKPLYEIEAKHNIGDGLWSDTLPTVIVKPTPKVVIDSCAHLLIADDICGSGETLTAVTQQFLSLECGGIITATLCRNIGSTIYPNFWLWPVDDWVVFPWEPQPSDIQTEPLRQVARCFFHPSP
jgi:uncharacterized protein